MRNVPFIFIILPLCAGISFAEFIGITLGSILIALCFTIFLAYDTRRIAKGGWLFEHTIAISFFLIGLLATYLHDHRNDASHYSNIVSTQKEVCITGRVHKRLKPSTHWERYEVLLQHIDGFKTSGKLLLNVRKDTLAHRHHIDEKLFFRALLNDIKSPSNPWQFNYKNYLERRHIYHRVFVDPGEVLMVGNYPSSIYGIAEGLRNAVNRKLSLYDFEPPELQIINALLLGQKQEVDPQLYETYAEAGAVHVLAVSGLHIGIIWLLLDALLLPLQLIRRGRYLKLVVILWMLWCFAVIAGLSPSVVRAVTMFTAIAIATSLKRGMSTVDALLVSMFFLLMAKPNFLFEVGFQLSYVAVFAIVWIQPMIEKLWRPKFWLFKKAWQLFTVTLAAQIGVLPLSLYYFHQFPGLFFVSNLVIVPFLGFILGVGLLVIVLALANALPAFMADAYSELIELMNLFVSWVANQESFLFENIPMSRLRMISIYLLIISAILLLKRRSYASVFVTGISIVVLQVVVIEEESDKQTKQHLIVFHTNRSTALLSRVSDRSTFHTNLPDSIAHSSYPIKAYLLANPTNDVTFHSLKDIYSYKDQKLLIVDSLGIYKIPSLERSTVLLTSSPKINLNRLIDTIKPEAIIADGSNHRSYVARWKATCARKKIPFHSTYEKGIYMIE